jgi:hypothetical protein
MSKFHEKAQARTKQIAPLSGPSLKPSCKPRKGINPREPQSGSLVRFRAGV